MDFFIFPYKAASKGAIALSEKLDCYRINRTNSTFRRSDDKIIINWGWGDTLPREVAACPHILNKSSAVAKAVDKISSFQAFEEAMVRCPTWTTHKEEALGWLRSVYSVFARTTTHGCDGAGIKFISSEDFCRGTATLPDAPLYTKHVTSDTEYRVNVFQGEALSYQRKVTLSGADTTHRFIRTSANGWGFEVAEERDVPPQVDAEAVAAVEALGLDFGGVDVLFDTRTLRAYVLEVNTAPELTPYALGKFANALKWFKSELEDRA